MYRIYLNDKFIAESENNFFQLNNVDRSIHNVIKVFDTETGLENILAIAKQEETNVIEQEVNGIEEAVIELSDDVNDYKGKAGWYTFPDGHKVRGEENAIAYLESLK